MAFDVGAVFIPVLPNLSGFGPALNKGLSGATSGISAVGAATTAAAVGLGVFAAASVKAAIDFDRSFTRIAAISNTSAGAIEGLKDQVMTLSGETAIAPTELADALFFLSSAGLKASEVMPALEASAQAAAVGLGSTADVANIVASAMNAYAKEGLTAAEVTDTLVAAVREGRAEPEEFAQALGRILPIASAVGVTFDQVAASMAVLSNVGLDVNEGVTAMRGVLQAIAAPGTQAAEAMNAIGVTAQELLDVISKDGIVGALQLLETATREVTKGDAEFFGVLRKIVPNVRALTGVLNINLQQASKVRAIYDAVKDSTGDLGEAFRTTAESDAFQLQQAFNDIRIAGQDFARDALPAITNTMKQLAPVIEIVGKNLGILLGVMLAFKAGSMAAAAGAAQFGAALGPIVGIIAGAVIAGQTLNDIFFGLDQTVGELAASIAGQLEPALDAGVITTAQYAAAMAAVRDPTIANAEALLEVKKALAETALAQERETAMKAAAKTASDSYVDSLKTQAGQSGIAIEDLRGIGQASRVAAGGLNKVKEAVKELTPSFTAAIDPATKFKESFQISPGELGNIVRNSAKVQQTYATDLGKLDKMKVGEGLKRQLVALGPEMVHAFVTGNKGQQQKIAAGLKIYDQALQAVTKRLTQIMGSGGTEVASAFTQGMTSGLQAGSGSIYSTVTQIVNTAIQKARTAAEAASPSKKMFKLGLDLMTGLQEGITENEQKVIDAAQKVIDKAIEAMTKDLDKLQGKLDDVLSKASSFRQSLRAGFEQFLDLSGGFTQQVPDPANPDQMITVPASGASITEFMAAQVAGAQKLADVLKALKAQGAGTALLSQVAQGGAEGLAFGQTLLQQGPAGVTAVNDALNAIADLAGGTAEGITNKFFGEKIDDLRADVKQLTQNLRILEKPQRLLVEFRGGDANALRQYILEVLSHSSLQRAPL